jgi:hypothetical protein
MKVVADAKRSARTFKVGEMVLLKLQPYALSTVVNRPCPTLAMKYFGPYKVIEQVGTAAYKLNLPPHCQVHPVFHVSHLKPFSADYSHVFSELPDPPHLDLADLQPELILDRQLSKKGNAAVTQVLVQWFSLPADMATWEDYNVIKSRFSDAPA